MAKRPKDPEVKGMDELLDKAAKGKLGKTKSKPSQQPKEIREFKANFSLPAALAEIDEQKEES